MRTELNCRPSGLNVLLARLAIILLATASSLSARGADIVDAEYVAAALARGAVVWDVRDNRDYLEGHIPGAVNAGDIGAVLRDPNREDWVPTARVQDILGRAGIDLLNREVIAYGRTGDPNAYYALSGIRYFGGKAARVFHGGLDAWQAAGRPLSKQATTLPEVKLVLQPVAGELLWNPEILERIKSGRSQILDARTPKEFLAEDIRAIRGGHIPTAINVPFEQNWIDPEAGAKLAARATSTREGMALKPPAALGKLYEALDRDKEVVVYCQSGVRASVTAAVLRDLGFKDVKVYEPSWLGYAGMLSAPAEREVFLNVGALNGRIAGLQGKVIELEGEVGRLKGAR